MLELAGGTTVYLACGATDLRKSYHGLAAVIKLKFQLDPYSRCMFAFCNRRQTLIKILQWDGSGFWILMKRLDRDAFHWPDTPDELRQVTLKEMHWLCDGLSLDQKERLRNTIRKWWCKIPACQFAESTKKMRFPGAISTCPAILFSRKKGSFMVYFFQANGTGRTGNEAYFFR